MIFLSKSRISRIDFWDECVSIKANDEDFSEEELVYSSGVIRRENSICAFLSAH